MANPSILEEIDDSLVVECQIHDYPETCKDILNNSYNLKILTLNIRSIQQNFKSFLVTLQRLSTPLDIIILTECWLSADVHPSQIPGYRSYATKNNLNRAGGVVAYVRENWSETVSEPCFEEAEGLMINLSSSVTVFGVYRSPSFTQVTKFIKNLSNAFATTNNNSSVILAGDININILDTLDNKTMEYLTFMAEAGFLSAISEPTRGQSCLDHIFVKAKVQKLVGLVCRSSITDHDLAMLGLDLGLDKVIDRNRFFLKTDHKAVASELADWDWSTVTKESNPNRATEELHKVLHTVTQKHSYSSRTSRSNFNLKPWITPGLIRCQKHRDRLHLESRKHPNDPMRLLVYKRYRNFLTDLQHRLKTAHDVRELENNKNNPKGLWKVIKNIAEYSKSTSKSAALIRTKSTSRESVDFCNNYFANVGSNLAENLLTSMNKTESSLLTNLNQTASISQTLFFQPTDEHEVSKLISLLKNDSSPGFDNLKVPLLKAIKTSIVTPLTHIFNLSLSTGVFPDLWKKATVVPIHKNGPKDTPENYRPISLLPIFSKILEKIVNHRLCGYLERFSLLSDRQFGFRRHKSTEDAVRILTDCVSTALDNGQKCVGVFLDLARAFDTVSVPILLRKLECFGIRGTPLQWFLSYLTGRSQSVKIADCTSSELPTRFGVPQGSVLGPTLFILYMNDIFSVTPPKADLICYADDTAVLFYGDTWTDTLHKAELGMTAIKNWLDNNLLSLNIKKTKHICFHKTKASEPKFHIEIKIDSASSSLLSPHCSSISRTECIRYLGVEIDQHLSFKHHINCLSQRVRKLVFAMRLLRNSADIRTLKMVYVALCQSILSYCISVWGGASTTAMLGLERAQRSVLKVMLRKPYQYPTASLLYESQTLSVRQLFIFNIVSKMHRDTLISPTYSVLRGRRVFRVPQVITKTPYARRFSPFLLPFLYNRVSKIVVVQDLTVREMQSKIRKWLLTLSYKETEDMLKPLH